MVKYLGDSTVDDVFEDDDDGGDGSGDGKAIADVYIGYPPKKCLEICFHGY